MPWNWELADWPGFTWDAERLRRAENLFAQQAGILVGAVAHVSPDLQETIAVEWMTDEAHDTSAIEGEFLDRQSVQSSIRRHLGLKSERTGSPAEAGIAELMVNAYRNITTPLDEARLFAWHRMVMNGRRDVHVIGAYRQHDDPMQIVSGPVDRPRVHFEAPPSARVAAEMGRLFSWMTDSAAHGANTLPALARAGAAHIWFESIHPFEDGNGRVGRAMAETMLAQGLERPAFTGISRTILGRQTEYYQQLEDASSRLDLTGWLLWFAAAVIESQRRSEAQLVFILDKTREFERLQGKLNPRQERALVRMFEAGPQGFAGGLSAKNYMTITGAPSATATRDLANLVQLGALTRTGTRKSTRYHLTVQLRPVAPVSINDIRA